MSERTAPSASDPDIDGLLDAEAAAALKPTPADHIVIALLYMLVQLSTRGACGHVVLAIGRHLEMLAAHADSTAALRILCLQLRDQWLQYVADAQARAALEATGEGGEPPVRFQIH